MVLGHSCALRNNCAGLSAEPDTEPTLLPPPPCHQTAPGEPASFHRASFPRRQLLKVYSCFYGDRERCHGNLCRETEVHQSHQNAGWLLVAFRLLHTMYACYVHVLWMYNMSKAAGV